MEPPLLMVQDSCDTLGASYTTDPEDYNNCDSEGCPATQALLSHLPLPKASGLEREGSGQARPRSPRTPQGQIVKNNFKVSYRRVVSAGGGGAKRASISYHSEFISPEILRDGRHGLFTHFEDQRKIVPPSCSPSFVRQVSLHPSPAMRVRNLRLFQTSIQDANAIAYYKTPNKPASSGKPEVGGASPKSVSSGRREVRGKLSFPTTPSAATAEQRESQRGETLAQEDKRERMELAQRGSPVSVVDAGRSAPALGRQDVDLGMESLCCELCGQRVNNEALANICKLAIPALQSRGRYLLSANTNKVELESSLSSEEHKEASAEDTSGIHRHHQIQMPMSSSRLVARRKLQKKILRRFAEETSCRDRLSSTSGGVHNTNLYNSVYPSFKSILEQGFAQKFEQQHSMGYRRTHTPVKDLIHSHTSRGEQHKFMDMNAATFLFASQMKLALNGNGR